MVSGLATQRGVKLFGVFISNDDAATAAPAEQVEKMMMKKAEVGEAEAAATKAKKAKRVIGRPPQTQELPSEYMDIVAKKGGEELTLITGKIVTATDLGKIQNRLSIPQGQIRASFLNDKEERLVSEKRTVGGQDRYVGVDVMLLDPSMKERPMNLARWNSDKDENNNNKKKKSWWFALKNDWVSIAAENGLHEGDAIQIWSFRFNAGRCLGFVLHKVQPPPPAEPSATTHNRKRKRTNVTAVALAQTSTPPTV